MLTTKTQSILFNSNGFECNEELAFELTAVAVKELDAIGIYRIPGERSDMFLAIMNKAEGIDCISKM
jgi:hypothetical protein